MDTINNSTDALEKEDDNPFGQTSSVVAPHVDKDFEFYIGMPFRNEEEAYKTYNAYGFLKGFGVRKGNKKYDKHGKVTSCNLVCSCEGFSDLRGPGEPRIRERVAYRCGCKARITFQVRNDLWTVIRFQNEHNHPMVEDGKKHFLNSARFLGESGRSIIGSISDSGIKEKPCMRFSAKQAGGIANVGFADRDVHNSLRDRKESMIGLGDAQPLINRFESKQAEDPQFFYTFQMDEQGRLCNFFRRDAVSKLHYSYYGDIVVFDTTFRTNKYNLICAPFVGVNNHWKNIVFGCGFLCDESAASFKWLFESFSESMGGAPAPKTIFTDQEASLHNKGRDRFIYGGLELDDALNGGVEMMDPAQVGDINACAHEERAEPYEGMEFDSEDAATVYYDEYARRMGFSTRVLSSRKSERDGSIISRGLGCKGIAEAQKSDSVSNDIGGKGREGCSAMFMVKRENGGRWVVRKFVRNHNHPLVLPLLKRRATFDEKDRKIQELTAELRVKKRLSAAYRDQLLALMKDVENHNDHLANKIQIIRNNLKELDVKRQERLTHDKSLR